MLLSKTKQQQKISIAFTFTGCMEIDPDVIIIDPDAMIIGIYIYS